MGVAVSVLIAGALVSGQTPPRVSNTFDEMLKYGGIMDNRTMEELQRKGQNQVETRSEATLSRLDVKAPGKARGEYNRGLQLLLQNKFQDAINRLSKAVSIYPEFVAAHNALGCAYFNLRQNDLARSEFTRAVQLDNHLSGSFLNLGRAELALEHIPAAQSALQSAFAIAPLDPNLPVVLGYVQYLNHDYTGAIRTAQQAHDRGHSGTALVHYFAAASWQAQDHLDETRTELETFLREDPESNFADQARNILEQIKARQQTSGVTSYSADVSTKPTDSKPSLLGLKVLQDLKEKRQIAEAEAAEGPAENADGGIRPTSSLTTKNKVGGGSQGGWTFRSSADEVAVFFTATDHGRSVTDLDQRDIAIWDDNKPPAAVLGFLSESKLPLRLGLLIDTSMSVFDRFSFEQRAATNFLRRMLTGKDDRAFVAGFCNSVVLAQDFTGDLNEIARGINQLVPIGGTALWDAVSFAADKLAETTEKGPVAKVLIVISDGDDNSSTTSPKQAIERSERDEVVIYTVSTRNFDPGNDSDLPGNHALRLLAERTGGLAFFPGSADHLNHSLAELEQVIRSRYLVGYRPAFFQRDGHYRSIAISARKSGRKLTIHCRKGYYTDKNAASEAHF